MPSGMVFVSRIVTSITVIGFKSCVMFQAAVSTDTTEDAHHSATYSNKSRY